MEVIDKKGETIQTSPETVDSDLFLKKVLPRYRSVRAGVSGGKYPFAMTYLEVKKREVKETVRMFKSQVTYSIMFNSKHDPKLKDTLYIHALKQTIV